MNRKKRSLRVRGKNARERRKQMVSLRRRGFTLAEIGDSFGVSGSRVSQILSKR
jgi:DNA-directed RNA polymerase specialized sigma subunit